jgi:2-amino-4-hydroxy-6-hydroxymethyldihydropteridine diphosphokinase
LRPQRLASAFAARRRLRAPPPPIPSAIALADHNPAHPFPAHPFPAHADPAPAAALAPSVRVAIALGANQRCTVPGREGDPAATIRRALADLALFPGISNLRASTLHTTPAVSTVPQPDFVNAAATFTTTLPPRALLNALLTIESHYGRARAAQTPPSGAACNTDPAAVLAWLPRTLDLDILLYGDAIIHEPALTIPHPRLATRRFVLAPLAEIWPDAPIPTRGTTVAAALAALAASDRAPTEPPPPAERPTL